MIKVKASLIAAAAVLALAPAARAQSSVTTGSGAVAGSTSAVIVGGLSGGASSAATAGGILGSGVIGNVGQTTGGNSVMNSDACQKIYNYTAGPFGVGGSSIVKLCWGTRMADMIQKHPPGTLGYELFCTEDSATDNMFLDFDWRSGVMACAKNKEKLGKMRPTQPVAAAQTVSTAPTIPAGCRRVPGTTAITC